MAIIEHIVEIEGEGVGVHGGKSLFGEIARLNGIETRNSDKIEVATTINVVEVESQLGVIGGNVKLRCLAAKAVGNDTERIAETEGFPPQERTKLDLVCGGKSETLITSFGIGA